MTHPKRVPLYLGAAALATGAAAEEVTGSLERAGPVPAPGASGPAGGR